MILQVGVKAIIKNSDGAYLFLKRTSVLSTDSHGASWDIPGGRINPGEQLLRALRREVREEIGHNIRSDPQLLAAQDILVPSKDMHVVRLTYLIKEDIPAISLSDEHDDFHWLTANESDSITMEPYLAHVFRNL